MSPMLIKYKRRYFVSLNSMQDKAVNIYLILLPNTIYKQTRSTAQSLLPRLNIDAQHVVNDHRPKPLGRNPVSDIDYKPPLSTQSEPLMMIHTRNLADI